MFKFLCCLCFSASTLFALDETYLLNEIFVRMESALDDMEDAVDQDSDIKTFYYVGYWNALEDLKIFLNAQ